MLELNSYFKAVSSELYADKNRWETTQIGRGIDTHVNENFPKY